MQGHSKGQVQLAWLQVTVGQACKDRSSTLTWPRRISHGSNMQLLHRWLSCLVCQKVGMCHNVREQWEIVHRGHTTLPQSAHLEQPHPGHRHAAAHTGMLLNHNTSAVLDMMTSLDCTSLAPHCATCSWGLQCELCWPKVVV